MKKVKINADEFAADILRTFFRKLSDVSEIVQGLEIEHLVLLEWNRKNYLKTQFEKSYKASMMPHEAMSMQRMLFRLGLADPMAAIVRDGICDQISRQLPSNQSRIQQN